MSIRTVVELNHDYLHELVKNGDISKRFEQWILEPSSKHAIDSAVRGVTVLASRHHSETLSLEVV